MAINHVSRRRLIKGVGTLAALAASAPGGALAQQGKRAAGTGRPSGTVAPTLPARGEMLIRGATVLTMDAKLGDFARGDIHVRNGAIVAVGGRLEPPRAELVEGRGMIAMPGFIDTHWHLWASILRPFVRSDMGELSYFPVSSRLGQVMTPEDSYRGVMLGLTQALGAGVTTVHNWSHNTRSPAHAEAELAAMRDAGIRGRFAYGTGQGHPDDQTMDLAGLSRIKREWMNGSSLARSGASPNASADGLLTLGICSRNIGAMNVGNVGGNNRGILSIEMAKRDWGGARELGLPITLHTSGASPIKDLETAGLLGPDVQLVHPLLTTPEERKIVKARGVSYSTAPIGESKRPAAVGEIQLGELLAEGIKVSLSTDQSANVACDPFVAMRTLYALHEHRIGSSKIPLTMKRLVQLATLDGAVDLGLDSQTGSLTPGKRADLILVRTTDPNLTPAGDPYETLVSLAETANIDTVIVDGRILRQGGRLTALDQGRIMREARDAASDMRARAKWPA